MRLIKLNVYIHTMRHLCERRKSTMAQLASASGCYVKITDASDTGRLVVRAHLVE